MQMTYHLYIVRCSDNSLYTGIALDIEKRIEQHNAGQGAKYTASRRPVILVYQEKCRSKSQALKKEWAVKKLNKQQKELLLQEAS